MTVIENLNSHFRTLLLLEFAQRQESSRTLLCFKLKKFDLTKLQIEFRLSSEVDEVCLKIAELGLPSLVPGRSLTIKQTGFWWQPP